MTERRTQADRSAATRAALLDAARALFSEKGYTATGREEIAAAAGVTRGALYHHFANKKALFRAVYLALEVEIVNRVAEAAVVGEGPMEQLLLGTDAYLDAAMDPAVQRVVLLDGPAILGLDERRQISEEHGLGLVREALKNAMEAGVVARQPVEPLAHVLLAGLHEAALFVAEASDQGRARAEVGETLKHLVRSL